jgi:predicted transcriptional regulator
MPHNDDRRRILQLLANTGPCGVTEAALIANEVAAKILAEFLRAGWATVATETVRTGAKAIDVRRYRITDAGRKAVEW